MNRTNSKLKTKKIIQLSLLMFGFLLFFVSGAFNKDTTFERVGEYITNVVTKETKDRRYCAVAFEATNKSGDYYGTEFSNLFDVFRSGVVTYTSAMNVNKEEDITFSEYKTESLSFVFLGPVGSTDIKGKDDEVIGYRHYLYNFNTMFKDARYNGSEFDKKHSSIIYLSETQANNILEARGVTKGDDGKFSISDYQTLIQKPVDLKFNADSSVEYIVWNIYYDDVNNFYYSGIKDVLGEFVLTSYYQPANHNLRDSHKSLYFFNEYSYYNEYLMRYLNERLASEKPSASIVKNNLLKDINEEYFLSFYLNESIGSNEWAYYVLLCLSICSLMVSLCLFFINQDFSNLFLLINLITMLMPYLIFKLIYVFAHDVLFFSQPSCKTAAICGAIYALIVLLASVYKTFSAKASLTSDFYETDI